MERNCQHFGPHMHSNTNATTAPIRILFSSRPPLILHIRIPIANIDESLHIMTLSCVDAFILGFQQTFLAYSQVIWANAPNSTDAQTTVNTIGRQTLSQTHGLQKLALIYFNVKQPSTSLGGSQELLGPGALDTIREYTHSPFPSLMLDAIKTVTDFREGLFPKSLIRTGIG